MKLGVQRKIVLILKRFEKQEQST